MDAPPPITIASSGPPKRHGCLLTWLILMLIGDAVTIILKALTPVMESALAQLQTTGKTSINVPHQPGWVIGVVIVLAIFDIVCVISLFSWKKWGFYGSVAASLLIFASYLASGLGIIDSLACLISPIVLYIALQIGGPNSGWKQLK